MLQYNYGIGMGKKRSMLKMNERAYSMVPKLGTQFGNGFNCSNQTPISCPIISP